MYFSTMSIGERKYRDGGMVANNPAELAYDEVKQMHEQRPRLVVSIGTGEPAVEVPNADCPRTFKHIKDGFGTAKGMAKLLTQCQNIHLRLDDRLEEAAVDYHRFNVPNGIKGIPLDEWKAKHDGNETIDTLTKHTVQYLKHPPTHKSLLQCARLLVAARRRRAATERWESFATRYVYYCQEKSQGNECTSTFKTREDFRKHAYDAHGYVWETRVCDCDPPQWACFWDQCYHGGVYVFRNRDEYVKHLAKKHNVRKGEPKFASRLELERWLDRGRTMPDEALDRLEQRRTAFNQPNSEETMPAGAPERNGYVSARAR